MQHVEHIFSKWSVGQTRAMCVVQKTILFDVGQEGAKILVSSVGQM